MTSARWTWAAGGAEDDAPAAPAGAIWRPRREAARLMELKSQFRQCQSAVSAVPFLVVLGSRVSAGCATVDRVRPAEPLAPWVVVTLCVAELRH